MPSAPRAQATPPRALRPVPTSREARKRRRIELYRELAELEQLDLEQDVWDAKNAAQPERIMVSTTEYGAQWCVHPDTVRRWARDGYIHALRLDDGRWRVHRDAQPPPKDAHGRLAAVDE